LAKLLAETPPARVRELSARGEHRTEATEVAEGDLGWLVAKLLAETPPARVRELSARREHRTEATEVTEGDWGCGWWQNF
jgi:hypothetical protein